MADTTGYILAFATLIAAGLFGVVVLPATESPQAVSLAQEVPNSWRWLRMSA